MQRRLEAVDTTEAEGTVADTESDIEGNSPEDTEAGQDTTKKDTAYTKTADNLTITCSEVYANSQAVYVTMQFKSEQSISEDRNSGGKWNTGYKSGYDWWCGF